MLSIYLLVSIYRGDVSEMKLLGAILAAYVFGRWMLSNSGPPKE